MPLPLLFAHRPLPVHLCTPVIRPGHHAHCSPGPPCPLFAWATMPIVHPGHHAHCSPMPPCPPSSHSHVTHPPSVPPHPPSPHLHNPCLLFCTTTPTFPLFACRPPALP